MDINWIIVEDRPTRIEEMLTAIKNLKGSHKAYIRWMAQQTGEETQISFLCKHQNKDYYKRVTNLELPENVEGPCILLVDLRWSEYGCGEFNSLRDLPIVRDWLENALSRIAFIHSSGDPNAGINAIGTDNIVNYVRHPRFLSCPGDTSSSSKIVTAAWKAYEKTFTIGSGIDYLLEVFRKKESDPLPNHKPNYHWAIVEKMLAVNPEELERFYSSYCGNQASSERPDFEDGQPDLAEPIYSAIKELAPGSESVSAIAAWFLVWSGMRSRIQLDAPTEIEGFDTICFDALAEFRKLGLKAKDVCRGDYLAGGFMDRFQFERCLRLLFRFGYDLAVDDQTKELRFKGVTLNRDRIEIMFNFANKRIVGHMHKILEPIFGLLLDESERDADTKPALPEFSGKEVLRRLSALNGILGFGGYGNISERRFGHYFSQKGDTFTLGFMRFREPD